MPISWGYYNQDLKHLRAIHRRFGSKPLTTYPQLGFAKFVYAVLVRGVKYIPILNLLQYNKEDAKHLITSELGWRDYGGKHHESLYTKFFQNFILPRKFGYDKRRAHLSTLVCSGQMSRQQAVDAMEMQTYPDGELVVDREYVIKKLKITESVFDELMRRPVRKHLDYPSNNFLYHEMKTLKDVFKRIVTAA
jgi:hypothetical protein